MAAETQQPRYMEKLLEELGWNQGTRIPLANPDNQALENLLIDRQNEIQRLRETLTVQKQKRTDLDTYKANVLTEYQENTRILFAQKQQLEQEVKLRQLAINENSLLERDIIDCHKKSKDLKEHNDRFHATIAKLLKRADELKSEVCDERVALQDWRAAIERGAGDIDAINQFTKEDASKAKALELQRQKLKVEHDKMQNQLNQMMSNLAAEERVCERISQQVLLGIESRKEMMRLWCGAVENLRERDKDIRHVREDYKILEQEASRVAEECREQQAFFDQQCGNNMEAWRENLVMDRRIGDTRIAYNKLLESNIPLANEVKSLTRELENVNIRLSKLRSENKEIMDRQHRKDVQIQQIDQKIKDLKKKVIESRDKSKSAEKRGKQLEEMLNEEERYASNLTTNQQRAIHCAFVENQKLLVLKNEEKVCKVQFKSSRAIQAKLDCREAEMEKRLQSAKENLYTICYQVETLGASVLKMEGEQTERGSKAELVEKENRLKEVLGRHMARVTLLERHSARLQEDMRRLTREIEVESARHLKVQTTLKTAMLTMKGCDKELKSEKEQYRRERVEEALLKLRAAHTGRAVANIEDTSFSLETQRLELDAAMNERIVEIHARRDMFATQKRSLLEDCGKLRMDINERANRIEQLKKRYDIFIALLGKDDSGGEMSVSYFKIKFAAERAELRERGASLDAEIGRRERDIAALEATMKVIAAAHATFMRNILPLADDTPEIEEVKTLTTKYYEILDELKAMRAQVVNLEQSVNELRERRDMLSDKNRQLIARESEAESELENARDRRHKQEIRLDNAHEVVKYYCKRAKKLIETIDWWRIFQLALWIRDYAEAAHNAINALSDVCTSEDSRSRFASLLASTDLVQHMDSSQRRLLMFVQRIITENVADVKSVEHDVEGSVFSTSAESSASGASQASGYTQRFAAFRKILARKVQEPAILEELDEKARRSTVSLRVVTLGLEESTVMMTTPTPSTTKPRKK